jgi:hypothetical protein
MKFGMSLARKGDMKKAWGGVFPQALVNIAFCKCPNHPTKPLSVCAIFIYVRYTSILV